MRDVDVSRFETPKLPPGTYLICFEQEGFKRRKIEKVALTRNQDRDLGIVRLDRSRRLGRSSSRRGDGLSRPLLTESRQSPTLPTPVHLGARLHT